MYQLKRTEGRCVHVRMCVHVCVGKREGNTNLHRRNVSMLYMKKMKMCI